MKKAIIVAEFVMYWSLILIPFAVAVGSAIANILIGFSIFFFLLKKILKREWICEYRCIVISLGCMLAVSLVSFRNTIDFYSSIQGIEKILLATFLFFIASQEIQDSQHLKRVALGTIAGAAFASIDAIWQMVFGFDFIRHYPPMIYVTSLRRATAGFNHTNMLGIYLAAITPLGIGLARYYYRGRNKLFFTLIAALIVAGVVLTYSRGALVGIILAAFFLIIAKKDKVMLIPIIVAFIVAPFLLPNDIKNFSGSVQNNPLRFMLNDDRISIYRNSVNMIKHHPFIGVGVNTFCKNYKTYKVPEPSYAVTGDSMYAHNNFLQMGGEIGLLGVGAFLAFLFFLFRYSWKIYLLAKDHFLKIATLSLIACVIAFLVNGLTETSLYNSKVAVMFWYLAGLALSGKKIQEA